MATIGNVTDLTKRKGKPRPVGMTSKEISSAEMPFSFLEEVWIGTSKYCYFSHNLTLNSSIEYNFEIGLINIPQGFQFVEYFPAGANKADWDNKKGPLKRTIYTHFLLNVSKDKSAQRQSFHHCENSKKEVDGEDVIGLHDRTFQGCAQQAVSHQADDANPFVLFYYFGRLYFSDNNLIDPNDYNELPEQGYYLIPLVLSERITVYYVIPEDADGNYKERLTVLREMLPQYISQQTENYAIGLTERIQLNDKLGIFVTRSLLDLP